MRGRSSRQQQQRRRQAAQQSTRAQARVHAHTASLLSLSLISSILPFRISPQDDTFLESCGVADLITTCYGGRNRKCAEAFAAAGKKKSLDDIEAELLGGQKLQGTLTAKEVNHILKMKGLEAEFPFFTTVYKISYEDTPLSAITETPY